LLLRLATPQSHGSSDTAEREMKWRELSGIEGVGVGRICLLGIPGGLRHLARCGAGFSCRASPSHAPFTPPNLFTRSPLAGAFFKLLFSPGNNRRDAADASRRHICHWPCGVRSRLVSMLPTPKCPLVGTTRCIVLATDADLRDPARDLFLLTYVGPVQI